MLKIYSTFPCPNNQATAEEQILFSPAPNNMKLEW